MILRLVKGADHWIRSGIVYRKYEAGACVESGLIPGLENRSDPKGGGLKTKPRWQPDFLYVCMYVRVCMCVC